LRGGGEKKSEGACYARGYCSVEWKDKKGERKAQKKSHQEIKMGPGRE